MFPRFHDVQTCSNGLIWCLINVHRCSYYSFGATLPAGAAWCSWINREAITLISTQRECNSANACFLCCLQWVGVHAAAIEWEESRTQVRQVACPKLLFLEVAAPADHQVSWLLQCNHLIPLIKISVPVVGNAKHAWLSCKKSWL